MKISFPQPTKSWRPIQFCLVFLLSLFSQFAFANFPDLKLENVQIISPITSGTPTSYSIDLVNAGTVDVTGPINISIYLSDDSQWSAKDILLDEFVQMRSVGTTTLVSELTIPDMRGGKFYLIFQVDKIQAIVESNELNNQLLHPIEIAGQVGDIACSFVKSFPYEFYVDASPTLVEHSDGYNIRVPLNSAYNDPDFHTGVLSTDIFGNTLGFDTINISKPQNPNYNITYRLRSPEFHFEFVTTDGDTVFNKPVLLNGNHVLDNMLDDFVKVIPFKDGFLLIGTYEYLVGTNGRGYEFFAITTDQMGNVLTQSFYESVFSHHGVSEIIFGEDGSVYLWTNSIIGFDHLFKIDPDGNIAFSAGAVAGSTGSWLQEIRLSTNGDYLWGRIGSNHIDEILRVDTETGATRVENPLHILSANSPDGDDFFSGFSFDKDGNILLGQRFFEWANDPFEGFEIGLMTPEFDLIWEHRIEDTSRFRTMHPVGEVSTGYMFLVTRLDNDGGKLIKVASDGTLTADCEDENSTGTLTCDLNYTFLNNQLILDGNGINAPHLNIKVFDGNWNFLEECMDCGNTIDLPNTNSGKLILLILLMDDDWKPICEAVETIDLQNGNSCTDADNDNICIDEDCDDNNTNIGSAGSACDDGNPLTVNDVLTANCKCEGTPIPQNGCPVIWSINDNELTIRNIIGTHSNISVYDENLSELFNCHYDNGDCNETEIVNLPGNGIYYLQIQVWNGWNNKLCQVFEKIRLNSLRRVIAFEAKRNLHQVDLTWTSDASPESNYFQIQKSEDGVHFFDIKMVDAINDGHPKFYASADTNPFEGANFYRIKLSYLDGSVEYSEIRKVHINDVEEFGLYPNPAQEAVMVSLEKYRNKNIEIQLIDQLGRLLNTSKISNNDQKFQSINLSNLNNGIYTIWVFADGHRAVGKKLIVNRMY